MPKQTAGLLLAQNNLRRIKENNIDIGKAAIYEGWATQRSTGQTYRRCWCTGVHGTVLDDYGFMNHREGELVPEPVESNLAYYTAHIEDDDGG